MSPLRPLPPCPHPGCPNLGDCPAHGRSVRRRAYDQARGSASARGYGAPWRRSSRAIVLARDPICRWGSESWDQAEPDSCHEPSTDAAHLVPREEGGSDDPENCRGLCHRHHSGETSARESWNRSR